MNSFRRLVCGLVVAAGLTVAVVMVGLRTKCTPVLTAVRRVNHVFWNPRAMKTAGTPGAYASVIRHVGRTTGRSYETPIGAIATDDGFVIASPYGSQADWLKNVLASGSATIVDEGGTYRVDQPQMVPSDSVASHFSPQNQRAHRWFGVSRSVDHNGAPVAASTPRNSP